MTRLDPSAGGLLTDWFTWTFIVAVFVIAGIWYAVFTIRAIRQDRLDAYDPQPKPATCQIGDCRRPATNVYDRHPSGALHVCDMHATRIQRWTGPQARRPAEQVYDQDLAAASDLALWDREVGS